MFSNASFFVFEVFNSPDFFKAPQEEQEGQSEEEQLKQKTKERARKEFLGAVASEGKEISSVVDLELIYSLVCCR